jgi:biopolymer transport protein ExbD/DNA-directed RNA polymerase subunit RPC12/RpoP
VIIEPMSIEVACQHCGALNHVNERLRGRHVRCPHCDGEVVVPERQADASKAISTRQVPASVSKVPAFAGTGTGVASGTKGSDVVVGDSPVNGSSNSVPAATSDEDDDVLPAKMKADDSELDMTPMVDVTFLLLIFFMITAAFSLQKSIESPRQESDKPSMNVEPIETEELDMVTVQINEFGSFLVMAPDWERETPGKQNLILALREAMGDGKTAMKLSIEVHEAAKLQALVDCMDAGTICDYGEVKVTQVESFDE